MLPDEYLTYGLTAMSRAMEADWNPGHYGAAVIAAYYFCRDNPLDDKAQAAIREQLDRLIAKHSQFFVPFPSMSEPDVSLIEQLPQALETNIDELRILGHNVIFTMLAVKALQQFPTLATPEVIDGLVRLISSFDNKTTNDILGVDVRGVEVTDNDQFPNYTNDVEIANFAFDEFLTYQNMPLEFQGHIGHLVTHAHSLVELSRLGYPELARKGYAAHRLQAKILRELHSIDRRTLTASNPAQDLPVSAAYWNRDAAQLEGRDWAYGHFFKYAYHYYDLLHFVGDAGKQRQIIRQMAQIL